MYLIEYKFMKAYAYGRFQSRRYIVNILSASHHRQLHPERRVPDFLWTVDVSGQQSFCAVWSKRSSFPPPKSNAH